LVKIKKAELCPLFLKKEQNSAFVETSFGIESRI
jgi:hypothetical protein